MSNSICNISWLGLVNKLLFQWLFIRLTRCQEKRIENYTLHSFDIMRDGNLASRGAGETKTYQWYSFQFWILPLTGWNSNFIYLNKTPKFIRVSKERLV
jgi:hypothetical protein